MFKWLFHILIFAICGKYQNKEKPLKRQRKLGLVQQVPISHELTRVVFLNLCHDSEHVL